MPPDDVVDGAGTEQGAPGAEREPYAVGDGSWIVTKTLQDSTNRMTFPPVMETSGIVYAADSIHWFCDTEQGKVLVADQKEPWRSEDRFCLVKSTNTTKKRVGTVPIEFFDAYTGEYGSAHHGAISAATDDAVKEARKPMYRMWCGHLYYFIVPAVCLTKRVPPAVYMVPVGEMVEIKGRAFAELFAPVDDIEPYLAVERDTESGQGVKHRVEEEETA